MPAVVSSDAAADFCSVKKFRMATHVLERREQLRPLLRAAVDAEALKRGASLEEVSRLHDELTRGVPVLERLLADGVAGRFPAEEVDMQGWRDMLKRSQELRLKLRKRLQRTARSSAPTVAEERKEESWETMEALREKHEALRQRRTCTSDIASLAQIERELYEVEEQLVSKKIAERLPVSLTKSATLTALERVEKARKELDEASRELLTALNLQGRTADSL